MAANIAHSVGCEGMLVSNLSLVASLALGSERFLRNPLALGALNALLRLRSAISISCIREELDCSCDTTEKKKYRVFACFTSISVSASHAAQSCPNSRRFSFYKTRYSLAILCLALATSPNAGRLPCLMSEEIDVIVLCRIVSYCLSSPHRVQKNGMPATSP